MHSSDITFGPPRRFAPVGDSDRINLRTLGYLELRPDENPPLPIRPVECGRKPGAKIASVYCWLRHNERKASEP